MYRKLIFSTNFSRSFEKLTKKNKRLYEELKLILELMEVDVFHPVLRTHKLSGEFDGLYSSKAGFDLRILFELGKLEEDTEESIILISIGKHDKVY